MPFLTKTVIKMSCIPCEKRKQALKTVFKQITMFITRQSDDTVRQNTSTNVNEATLADDTTYRDLPKSKYKIHY